MSNPIQQALSNPEDLPTFAQPGDITPETGRQGEDEFDRFPPNCPIKVLGINQGSGGKQTCYYLSYNGQMADLEAGRGHGKLNLTALFGPAIGWLEAHYGQYSKPVKVQVPGKGWVETEPSRLVGFDQAKAAQALVIECVRKGIFDPAGRLRGRGAHAPEKGVGGLVLHCGDMLYVSVPNAKGGIKEWKYIPAGEHERFVYQAGEALPRPWHDPVDEKPAGQLLALLQSWNWKRPDLDPILLLGGIGASMIGGALPWRPHIWITGGSGAGKSTLNGKDGVVPKILSRWLYRTGDTTAAGIRSHLLNSTVPVMLDEQEAEKNNHHNDMIIKLARISSSGENASRGSSNHAGVEFTLQSCFWFSSILIPPMDTQDRKRLAILELLPIKSGAAPPAELQTLDFGVMGRKLLKRMIDGWARLAATKQKFHEALTDLGHDNRACDQFGTLLACFDVLFSDDVRAVPSDEAVAAYVAHCRPQRMAEISETSADHENCLNHILGTMQQSRGGDERQQLATWIGQAMHNTMNTLLDLDKVKASHDKLHQIGLKLVNPKRHPEKLKDGKTTPARWGAESFDSELPGYLAVAASHPGLDKVFEGTKWPGGVWRQSLGRVPGSIEVDGVKFGYKKARAVLVPLSAVFDEDDLPRMSKPEAVADWVREQLAEHG